LGKIYETSQSLICKMKETVVPTCWITKDKKDYRDSWPITSYPKLGIITVTITEGLAWILRDILVPHLHFITKKTGALGNGLMCPRYWPF